MSSKAVSRALLLALGRRAVALCTGASSMSAASHLSSMSASLVALSNSNHAADTELLRTANDSVHQLAVFLPRITDGSGLGNDVAVHILRIAKSSTGGISPSVIRTLLVVLDERLAAPQLGQWGPQTVVLSLHAIAMAAPCSSLGLTEALFYCARELLSQLDERRTARLLWCMAVLRAESRHMRLWEATCRRLIRFQTKHRIPAIAQALIVEALLLVPRCNSDAQQELLTALHEAQMADPNELGDYNTLRSRLLADVHQLPLGSLLTLLARAGRGEEAPFLLQHLLQRQLRLGQCRRVLEVLISVPIGSDTRGAMESMCRRVMECVRHGTTNAEGDSVYNLGILCLVAALEMELHQVRQAEELMQESHVNPPEADRGASLHDKREVSLPELHSSRKDMKPDTRALLLNLLLAAHAGRDETWDSYNGPRAAMVAMALDLLSDPNNPTMSTCAVCLQRFPQSFGASNPSVATAAAAHVAECAVCVTTVGEFFCALPLRQVGAFNGSTNALLRRCASVLVSSPFLSRAAFFDMWHATTALVPPVSGLLPVVDVLLRYAMTHPSEFTLRDAEEFVKGPYVPPEAFELFVQRVSAEHGSVSSTHLEALIASLETIAARKDRVLMERLLLHLFLRPLGQEQALVQRVQFATPLLVRLYHCCQVASDVAVAMQTKVLELLETSCANCRDMEELNTATALLSQLECSPLKDTIAHAITERGKEISSATTPSVQKALLVVYLQKAGVVVEESLLEALRKGH